MLYDNALLITAYLDCYRITGNMFYRMVAEKTIEYVLRELTDKDGGFYCAQDADSEGVEGKYYVFTPDEINKLLGEENGKYYNNYYGITEKGNFEGKSIPNLLNNDEFDESDEKNEELSKIIYEYRLKRTRLHKDDKILTSWNALMIIALAKAYKLSDDEKYLTAAEKAINFIDEKLTDLNNRQNLFVRYREGETSGNGHIDDYAYLIWALIEMYEATFDNKYLNKALLLNEKLISDFFDSENGGFYLYGSESESLVLRPKELYDGATPSGNSVAAYNLLKLAKLTENSGFDEIALKQLRFINGNIQNYPAGYSFSMLAFISALYPSKEVVCVVNNDDDLNSFKKTLNKNFISNINILVKDMRQKNTEEFLKSYDMKNDKMTFYICENNACSAPFNDINELSVRLER
jgi:uncharacterized protein YyaL (SSP411 family)